MVGCFWDCISHCYRQQIPTAAMPTHHPAELHYNDVIMTTIVSQITSLAVVYSTVYLDADQRKHQSSASLAFVWGIHRDRWIPRTKGQLRGKYFHLMTSSWHRISGFIVEWMVHLNDCITQNYMTNWIQTVSLALHHSPTWRMKNWR